MKKKVRMGSLREPICVWDLHEWDTIRVPKSGVGGDGDEFYYETEEDDAGAEADADEEIVSSSPSGRSTTTFPTPSGEPTPSSSQDTLSATEGPADFKTYDYMHGESDDYLVNDGDLFETSFFVQEEDAGGGTTNIKRYIFPNDLRHVMKDYYKIVHRERVHALLNSKGNFPTCPKGDTPDANLAWKSRKHPGPFLSCPFSQCHESGDEFYRIDVDTKPLPDFHFTTRPPHFKERKAKFFKQCKNCETLGFMHHRNPKQHYEDYVNNVTYKQHKNQAKVWQQHLADLKYSLDVRDPDYEDISEKAYHYKPSPIIIYATRYSRPPAALRRKPGTSGSSVFTRRRTALIRRVQTPRRVRTVTTVTQSHKLAEANLSQKMAASKTTSKTEVNDTKENENGFAEEFIISPAPSKQSLNQVGRSRPQSGISSTFYQARPTTAIRSALSTANSKINKTLKKQQPPLHEKMKSSMNKLIRTRNRQDQSKFGMTHSKRYVKKKPTQTSTKKRKSTYPPTPRGTTSKSGGGKYISKLKPNISAKILRRNSRGTANSGMKKTKVPLKPSGTKSIRSKGTKSAMTFKEKEIEDLSVNSYNDFDEQQPQDSEDGSYAQFRDRHGNFDSEKYRKSILKMLETHSGSGARRERRKKEIRADERQRQTMSTSALLPKVKNQYRNVKSKTASNFPSKKKKKTKGNNSKGDSIMEELFGNTISDISLKTRYSNERFVGGRGDGDARFSVPQI